MRRIILSFRQLIILVVTSLLPVSATYASSDETCEAMATPRQNDYSCGAVPILSPGNDTRINAMLLMVNADRFAQTLPKPSTFAPADGTSELTVPFLYDFSTWIDRSQTQSGTGSDDAADGNQTDYYADGEGNICRSAASGDKGFYAALDSAKQLPADDAASLRAARAVMMTACEDSGTSAPWTKSAGLRSRLGQQFATYLDGARAFYQHDFFSATKAFASASHSTDPWLKETALYMTGRAQLNAAQAGVFDEHAITPDRSKVVKVSLAASDTVFRTYLRIYPHGLYSASAAGLQRRIAWLGDDVTQQARLYDSAFANWSATTSNVRLDQLANELDSKLLMTDIKTNDIQSPQLLAIIDLMRMRVSDSSDASRQKPIALHELQAQKPRFACRPMLFEYLLAAWYVHLGHQPEQALALLPQSVGASLDYFALSQQMLRGFALEDSGQRDKARQLWTQLIPLTKYPLQRETLELALAINLEQAGLVDRVFADDSPIQNVAIRETLIQRAASADLLRAQAQNKASNDRMRDLALYTLLYKELTRGHYSDFIADLPMIRDTSSEPLQPFNSPATTDAIGYVCPSIRDVAVGLQQDPRDAKGLNCLGEFMRRHPPAYPLVGDPIVFSFAQPAAAASPTDSTAPPLGSAPSQFRGKVVERITNYQTVIGDTRASADDRAYALYRAIRCFAPSGYSDCGGNDIPVDTRKRWFNTLKAAYPHSKAAQSLKYYW
ncbi:hypothetical protein BTH42_33250 [Burkholderia sp. SRS-W-2-2016]|uniref:hypothetical protein n=1 Tax=Burkholderia sp. SRS-W-2-2016 TaxID=1926878 RepID=UPI00094B0906|nr:hypothetical protein [Burkholderia sp. SRS-W-2-2016]OLL27367.1 hypothetical protein BTH42_33250 [Burkholderia sp. SRS-W-2-2016]